jgi:hypothetical protein
MNVAKAMIVAVAFAALAVTAAAQENPRARRQEHEERRETRRDEMFKMVDAYVAMNIEEKLGLSPDQFARVLPLVRRASADRRRFAEGRMDLLRSLRERLESGTATEAQVGDALRAIKEIEEEEPATLKKDRAAIDQLLTAVQQAKLRVLEFEVERRLRALTLRRAPSPPAE